MKYTYEIVSYDPKQLMITVRYSSDNPAHEQAFHNFRLPEFTEQAIREQIESMAHAVCDMWEKSEAAPEIPAVLQGPQQAVRKKLKPIIPMVEQPAHDPQTEKIVESWVEEADAVRQVLSVVPLTTEEIAGRARGRRDFFLRLTDHYALSDQTMPAAVAQYREALRAVPQQAGFPTNIVWPELSESLTNAVPYSITLRQARLALVQQGLLQQVEDTIAAMPEPEKSRVLIEWEYASSVVRTSPWITQMGQALGMTDAQMDDFFRLAITL